jgi:hypothetical protein
VDQAPIVCGVYTPDYAHWATRLAFDLNRLGIGRDIVEVPKFGGGWERNTMRKAEMVLAAMGRRPDRTVIFLDVDCSVRAPLDDLVSGIHADVATFIRVKRRGNGDVKWGGIRSGTLVLRPTPGARAFAQR